MSGDTLTERHASQNEVLAYAIKQNDINLPFANVRERLVDCGLMEYEGDLLVWRHRLFGEYLTASLLAEVVNGTGWQSKQVMGVPVLQGNWPETGSTLHEIVNQHGKRTLLGFCDRKAWDTDWTEILLFLMEEVHDPFPLLESILNPGWDDMMRHRLALGIKMLERAFWKIQEDEQRPHDKQLKPSQQYKPRIEKLGSRVAGDWLRTIRMKLQSTDWAHNEEYTEYAHLSSILPSLWRINPVLPKAVFGRRRLHRGVIGEIRDITTCPPEYAGERLQTWLEKVFTWVCDVAEEWAKRPESDSVNLSQDVQFHVRLLRDSSFCRTAKFQPKIADSETKINESNEDFVRIINLLKSYHHYRYFVSLLVEAMHGMNRREAIDIWVTKLVDMILVDQYTIGETLSHSVGYSLLGECFELLLPIYRREIALRLRQKLVERIDQYLQEEVYSNNTIVGQISQLLSYLQLFNRECLPSSSVEQVEFLSKLAELSRYLHQLDCLLKHSADPNSVISRISSERTRAEFFARFQLRAQLSLTLEAARYLSAQNAISRVLLPTIEDDAYPFQFRLSASIICSRELTTGRENNFSYPLTLIERAHSFALSPLFWTEFSYLELPERFELLNIEQWSKQGYSLNNMAVRSVLADQLSRLKSLEGAINQEIIDKIFHLILCVKNSNDSLYLVLPSPADAIAYLYTVANLEMRHYILQKVEELIDASFEAKIPEIRSQAFDILTTINLQIQDERIVGRIIKIVFEQSEDGTAPNLREIGSDILHKNWQQMSETLKKRIRDILHSDNPYREYAALIVSAGGIKEFKEPIREIFLKWIGEGDYQSSYKRWGAWDRVGIRLFQLETRRDILGTLLLATPITLVAYDAGGPTIATLYATYNIGMAMMPITRPYARRVKFLDVLILLILWKYWIMPGLEGADFKQEKYRWTRLGMLLLGIVIVLPGVLRVTRILMPFKFFQRLSTLIIQSLDPASSKRKYVFSRYELSGPDPARPKS